jgi:hypothetical protein
MGYVQDAEKNHVPYHDPISVEPSYMELSNITAPRLEPLFFEVAPKVKSKEVESGIELITNTEMAQLYDTYDDGVRRNPSLSGAKLSAEQKIRSQNESLQSISTQLDLLRQQGIPESNPDFQELARAKKSLELQVDPNKFLAEQQSDILELLKRQEHRETLESGPLTAFIPRPVRTEAPESKLQVAEFDPEEIMNRVKTSDEFKALDQAQQISLSKQVFTLTGLERSGYSPDMVMSFPQITSPLPIADTLRKIIDETGGLTTWDNLFTKLSQHPEIEEDERLQSMLLTGFDDLLKAGLFVVDPSEPGTLLIAGDPDLTAEYAVRTPSMDFGTREQLDLDRMDRLDELELKGTDLTDAEHKEAFSHTHALGTHHEDHPELKRQHDQALGREMSEDELRIGRNKETLERYFEEVFNSPKIDSISGEDFTAIEDEVRSRVESRLSQVDLDFSQLDYLFNQEVNILEESRYTEQKATPPPSPEALPSPTPASPEASPPASPEASPPASPEAPGLSEETQTLLDAVSVEKGLSPSEIKDLKERIESLPTEVEITKEMIEQEAEQVKPSPVSPPPESEEKSALDFSDVSSISSSVMEIYGFGTRELGDIKPREFSGTTETKKNIAGAEEMEKILKDFSRLDFIKTTQPNKALSDELLSGFTIRYPRFAGKQSQKANLNRVKIITILQILKNPRVQEPNTVDREIQKIKGLDTIGKVTGELKEFEKFWKDVKTPKGSK